MVCCDFIGFGQNAAINGDSVNWDFTTYEPQYVDAIWAYHLCIVSGCANTIGVMHLDKATKLVQHTMGIIECSKRTHWVVEKPHTGF